MVFIFGFGGAVEPFSPFSSPMPELSAFALPSIELSRRDWSSPLSANERSSPFAPDSDKDPFKLSSGSASTSISSSTKKKN